MRLSSRLLPVLLAAATVLPGAARAEEPFIGEIKAVAFNFAPRGWAKCDGQLLSVAQNSALFSLLGTTYGGDGRTTFGLPDLRGRAPIHAGQGPGLGAYRQGQKGGRERVTLTTNQLGQPVMVASPRKKGEGSSVLQPGGGQAHDNMQPYLAVNYVIALQGIYPSRS